MGLSRLPLSVAFGTHRCCSDPEASTLASSGHQAVAVQVVEESDINNRELEICRILSRGNHPNICDAQASQAPNRIVPLYATRRRASQAAQATDRGKYAA